MVPYDDGDIPRPRRMPLLWQGASQVEDSHEVAAVGLGGSPIRSAASHLVARKVLVARLFEH